LRAEGTAASIAPLAPTVEPHAEPNPPAAISRIHTTETPSATPPPIAGEESATPLPGARELQAEAAAPSRTNAPESETKRLAAPGPIVPARNVSPTGEPQAQRAGTVAALVNRTQTAETTPPTVQPADATDPNATRLPLTPEVPTGAAVLDTPAEQAPETKEEPPSAAPVGDRHTAETPSPAAQAADAFEERASRRAALRERPAQATAAAPAPIVAARNLLETPRTATPGTATPGTPPTPELRAGARAASSAPPVATALPQTQPVDIGPAFVSRTHTAEAPQPLTQPLAAAEERGNPRPASRELQIGRASCRERV